MSTLSLFIFILGYCVYFLFVDRLKPLCCVCFPFLFFGRKKMLREKFTFFPAVYSMSIEIIRRLLSIGVKIQADGNVNCKFN